MTQQIGTRKVSLVEISAREIRDLTSNSNFYPLETHCETEEYFPAPLPPIRWRPHWGRGRAAGPRASPSGSPPLKTVAGRKRRRPSVRPSVDRQVLWSERAGGGPRAVRNPSEQRPVRRRRGGNIALLALTFPFVRFIIAAGTAVDSSFITDG